MGHYLSTCGWTIDFLLWTNLYRLINFMDFHHDTRLWWAFLLRIHILFYFLNMCFQFCPVNFFMPLTGPSWKFFFVTQVWQTDYCPHKRDEARFPSLLWGASLNPTGDRGTEQPPPRIRAECGYTKPAFPLTSLSPFFAVFEQNLRSLCSPYLPAATLKGPWWQPAALGCSSCAHPGPHMTHVSHTLRSRAVVVWQLSDSCSGSDIAFSSCLSSSLLLWRQKTRAW